jgi:RecG-like helicase
MDAFTSNYLIATDMVLGLANTAFELYEDYLPEHLRADYLYDNRHEAWEVVHTLGSLMNLCKSAYSRHVLIEAVAEAILTAVKITYTRQRHEEQTELPVEEVIEALHSLSNALTNELDKQA